MSFLPWFVCTMLVVGILVFVSPGWRRIRLLFRKTPITDRPDAEMAESTDTLAPYALSETKVRYACGHEYADRIGVDFYGEKMEVDSDILAKRERCGDCVLAEFKPFIIRCALCGRAIGPGDAVAVYGNYGHSFHREKRTTPDGHGVLGCLRSDCCPSGGFFAGHWSGRAFVPAFAEGSIASHVLATGKAVAVNVEDDGSINVKDLDDEQKK